MKFFIGIIIFTLSSTVTAAGGWTGYGTITEFNQQPGGVQTDVYIKASLPNNGSGCTDTGGFMLLVESDRDERMFSMLLAAFMAGKEVRLFYTGECHAWNVAMVKGVYVK